MVMSKLIEALQIFLKYKDLLRPTHCEHDVLFVMGVTKEEVSADDAAALDALGFFWNDDDECWMSFQYGSA
jgi:hypothetical protein